MKILTVAIMLGVLSPMVLASNLHRQQILKFDLGSILPAYLLSDADLTLSMLHRDNSYHDVRLPDRVNDSIEVSVKVNF